MTKEYVCECGKIFTKPNSFNAHKSNCKTHYLVKYGNLDKFIKKNSKSALTRSKIYEEKSQLIKKEKLQQWISEEHTCEKCGKIMIEKFGSGRFCSRSCANSKVRPDNVRKKISESVKKTYENIDKSIFQKSHKECLMKYLSNPSHCKVCGKILSYEKRFRKTCSQECFTKQISKNGGFKEGSVKNHKYGHYRGIQCDSSWELAFLAYHLDNNIEIKRNKDGFKYIFNDTEHTYYPDFIVNDTYVEIKNYITPQVEAKIKYFPKDLKYKIFLYNDLKVYIDYCVEKYGKKYWDTLYD